MATKKPDDENQTSDENPTPVVELSRWRAALGRARKGHRAELLVEDEHAAELIPTLPVQELYYAIEEVGLEDAHDLLALCTVEQVQGLVDLDVWEKDHLVPARLARWLEAVQSSEADNALERFGTIVEGLDPEVISLFVLDHAIVYDLELDLPPEEPEGHFVTTPDSFFLLDVTSDSEAGKRFDHFVDWLYRADINMARRVLMTARSETLTELEENAYRWRSGRMADLGYAEFYEALGVYRLLDPASVRLDEESAQKSESAASLPSGLLAPIDERGFFSRAMSQLGDEATLERVRGHLMTLANRVMSAELVRPGDLAAAQSTLGRTLGYLNVGLEYLTKGDLEVAKSAIVHIALERLFRLGFTLTRQLSALTNALYTKGNIRLPETSGGTSGSSSGDASHHKQPGLLLDPPFDALVEALHRARPQYVELTLDDTSNTPAKMRPFAQLAEIGRAALALEEAARAPATLALLGVEPATVAGAIALAANPPSLVRFSTLALTLGARLLLDGPNATLRPLSPAELKQLGSLEKKLPELAEALRTRLASALSGNPGAASDVQAQREGALRFIDRWTHKATDLLVSALHSARA